jgi:ferredoxin
MLPSHTWYGPVPGWLIFYAMIAAALVLFARRAFFLLRLLRKGKPMPRWDRIPARIGRMIVYVFAQARLLAYDFWPGLMHATIFWGFVVLTLGTLEFFGRGVTESFFLPLLSETSGYLVLQDLFSALVIVAVAYALFRRLVTRPKRLNLSTEAVVILLLILGLMVTDLLADAAHLRLHPAPHNHWQFAASAIASCLGGLPPAGVQVLFHLAWWSHAALLLGFLVLLPYSKHLHILLSPLNVFFSSLEPKGRFRTVDLENSETFGVGNLTELAWKDLFDTYNCTECGRCTSRCPANMSGKELDPKWLILHLRERLFEEAPALLGRAGAAAPEKPLVGEVVHDNVLWACTTCRWCVDACPVFIEHVPKIVDMRRWLVLTE